MKSPERGGERPWLLLPLLTVTACGGATIDLPVPGEDPAAVEYRGEPGFDTREYPGDEAMGVWHSSSPYRWVGYYLPAPCHTGTSWTGRRAALQRAGWGLAVIFVGEQDWSASGLEAEQVDPAAAEVHDAETADSAAAAGPPRCVTTNLTAERGRADADAAVQALAGEGFSPGSAVFLDVERVENVSDSLRTYVAAWTERMLEDGSYVPALYAHGRNALDLIEIFRQEFGSAGRSDQPLLWVASAEGFDVRSAPAESGFPADIWQGRFDVDETWGEVTLRVDVNTAESADPSAPAAPVLSN